MLKCNADRTHILPARCIGTAVDLKYFRTENFEAQRLLYNFQPNAWIDSKRFSNWIKWWYEEIKNKSTGPWLLIMDNCGGKESQIHVPGVNIVPLPPRCTAKYQSLDFGLIAYAKSVVEICCCE